MRIKLSYLLLPVLLSFQPSLQANEAVLTAQQEKLDALMIDMNKTAKTIYEDIVGKPQGSEEASCLEALRDIDISLITVDSMGILKPIFDALKDQLNSLSCDAIHDYAQKQLDELEERLGLPIDITIVGLDKMRGNKRKKKTSPTINTLEVAESITNKVLSEMRKNNYKPGDVIKPTKNFEKSKANNSKDIEKDMKEGIDLDKFFGGDDEDDN